MEEEDWSDFDEEQEPATAMEAHQRASQAVAEFSPQQTPQPETKADIEMEEATNVVTIGLRTPIAEFLRMQNEDPPAKSQTEYPGSLESFKNQFTTWYKHRQSRKDHMPTPKSKQRKAIYFATVCLKLDYEKFFQARMNFSYFEVLYELTLGMTIQFDMRSDDEKHKKQPVLLIPFVQVPQFYQDDLHQKTRTDWYWSYEALSHIPSETLLAFFYFDARVQQRMPIDMMEDYEARDMVFFKERLMHLWTLQHYGSLEDTNLPTLPLRMEGDEG
jgi:hypothetical protein